MVMSILKPCQFQWWYRWCWYVKLEKVRLKVFWDYLINDSSACFVRLDCSSACRSHLMCWNIVRCITWLQALAGWFNGSIIYRLWCLLSWRMCQRFASEENSERFRCDNFCEPSEGFTLLISIEWADAAGKKIKLGSLKFFWFSKHVWIGKKAISSFSNCWEKISYMHGSD